MPDDRDRDDRDPMDHPNFRFVVICALILCIVIIAGILAEAAIKGSC